MDRIKRIGEQAPTLSVTQENRIPLASSGERVAAGMRIAYSQTRVVPVSAGILKKNRVLTGVNNDNVATAYKMLRTQVLRRMQQQGWKNLAITSAGPGEGKTLTAINLAISLARDVNHTVLLVDLDLRRPSVHQYFGYKPIKGLSDFLLGGATVPEILFNPGIERLVVLPSGAPQSDSSELLLSPKMLHLTEELTTHYDSRLVVFDMPPLLHADDALAFAPYVDAVLFVVEDGKTSRDDLTRSIELLQTTQVLGIVLNKATEIVTPYY